MMGSDVDVASSTAAEPAIRLSRERVLEQARLFSTNSLASALMDAGINCLLVLNGCRQIVAASPNILAYVSGRNLDELIGLRPGEAFDCIHATECTGGCGTTEFCRDCGALQAISAGLRGERSRRECHLARRLNGELQALDLDVMSKPFEMEGERFTLVAFSDVSHEKRRRVLERIFFHDVINLAAGVEGLLEGLRDSAPADILEEVEISYASIRELIDEVAAQRDLAAAERDELRPAPAMVNSLALLRRLAGLYESHPALELRNLVIDPESVAIDFVSDATLLGRVMGNLIKNAGEAAQVGQTVTMGCTLGGPKIVFWVRNPQVMPVEVRHQVFQRSFSTKGPGRGLGTYSVKLISEHCLSGTATFESVPPLGTTFRIVLPLVLQ